MMRGYMLIMWCAVSSNMWAVCLHAGHVHTHIKHIKEKLYI